MKPKQTLLLSLLFFACGGTQTAGTPPSPAEEPVDEFQRSQAAETLMNERSLDGAFLVRREGETTAFVAFPERADEHFTPASTFKMPNTLIGLETGVITGADFTIAWDGVERHFDVWNEDQTLASALEHSAVWFYQEVARRVGLDRMNEWIQRLDYGNQNIGTVVDTFWLEGPLTITPRQQLQFVERLNHGELPLSPETIATFREVMPRREVDGLTIVAKTGTALRVVSNNAWLVGWVENEGEIIAHFSLLLIPVGEDIPSRESRFELTAELLRVTGIVSDSE